MNVARRIVNQKRTDESALSRFASFIKYIPTRSRSGLIGMPFPFKNNQRFISLVISIGNRGEPQLL
jgi:hypothetical protein